MNSSTPYPKIWLIALFVLTAAVIRIIFSYIPMLANVSPVAAMALFGGYYFRDKRTSFSLTMLIMFLSDVALELLFRFNLRDYPGFHPAMPYVYVGFFTVVAIGGLLPNVKPLTLVGASLLSSVIFFIVSNFGVWMTGYYPATWSGLILCYEAGIPFFRYTIAGDLLFVGVMFGAFEWMKSAYLRVAKA